MADPTKPSLVTTSAPPPLVAPRGRLIMAEGIVKRHYLDAETGKPLVSTRWVRDNMPYKLSLSHSRVAWYENDVAAVIAESQRTGAHVKDVRLDYLERVA